MTHIHDMLASVQRSGAQGFGDTALARDHGPVRRRVGRARAARTATISVVGVGAAGVIAFAANGLVRGDEVAPVAPPSPSVTPSVTPSPTPDPSLAEVHITVAPGPRVDRVVEDLAHAYNLSEVAVMDALIASLPPEAEGDPEGWLDASEFVLAEGNTVQDAIDAMLGARLELLENVDRDQWRRTVIIASIIEQEIPGEFSLERDEALARMARLIENRLAAGMKLELQSPLAYDLRADERTIGDDGWAVDTPYNTFIHEGLPPGPIGAAAGPAVLATLSPAPGDWLYVIVDPATDTAHFSTTFEEHAALVDQFYPGTGASG